MGLVVSAVAQVRVPQARGMAQNLHGDFVDPRLTFSLPLEPSDLKKIVYSVIRTGDDSSDLGQVHARIKW